MGAEQVYENWVEARSFGCKKCGYTSTNRRLVEQHLRQNHGELFELPNPAAPIPREEGEDGGANGTDRAARPDRSPPSLRGKGAAGLGAILYTDAGTWDNGTPQQRSVLAVWDDRVRSIVIDEELPGTTNNEAEYAAIIAALELARTERLRGVLIRSDSQLCVRQIKGEWQIKEARLRPLRDRAARLLADMDGRIEWVPRGRNLAGIYLEKKYKR
jgi:ribonuclease HI